MGQIPYVGNGSVAAWGALSRPLVGHHLQTVAGLIRNAECPANWTACEKVLGESQVLVSEVGGCSCENDRLCLCCTSLVGTWISIFKLSQKMASLAFLFQLSGVGDVTKHFMVKRELSGYIRGKVILDARHLVSFELLGAILGCLGVICSSA